MKVVVLHNEASEDSAVNERDVLMQRNAIAGALRRLGHDVETLGCTLNLEAARRRLLDLKPDVVFNLVESLGGTDRLMSLATLLLDALGLRYTGSRTAAILATGNKLAAKARLHAAGLPTPPWLPIGDRGVGLRPDDGERSIVKPVWEHASFGMDDGAVVAGGDLDALHNAIQRRERQTGRPHFAEQFVDGREFNISLLASADGPQVLPHAEIDFSAFDPGVPRIVGFGAKWDAASFEYRNTPRRFDFPDADQPLLDELSRLARQCWRLFDLAGYARVDFRVDAERRPWILEVNANPCLSPDAGFPAALARDGLSYETAIGRILNAAHSRKRH